MKLTTIQRFENLFDKPNDNECWEWSGGLGWSGYGRFKITNDDGSRKSVVAHRFAYEEYTGKKIPEGFDIHHKCENILCVNPKHLQPLSRKDHAKTMNMYKPNEGKTHCKNGHEFNAENTYTNKKTGWRGCRKCHNERQKLFQKTDRDKQRRKRAKAWNRKKVKVVVN